MQVSLKPSLIFGFQADKFDSHADSRITGAHQDPRHYLFWSKPQFRTQPGPDRKGRKRFNITATAADVGRGDADRYQCVLVVQSDEDRNLVSFPPSSARVGNRRICLGSWKKSCPRAFQRAHKLHAYLNLLGRPRIGQPHYFASCFLFASPYSDDVTNLEILLDPREQCTCDADILGTGALGKSTTIRSDAPHTHVQVDGYALFRPGLNDVFHYILVMTIFGQSIKNKARIL